MVVDGGRDARQKKKHRADQTIGRESGVESEKFHMRLYRALQRLGRSFNFNRIPRWLPAGFADKRPDPLRAFFASLAASRSFFLSKIHTRKSRNLHFSLRARAIFNLTFNQLNFPPRCRADRSSVVINKIRTDTRETNHFFHFEISAINLDWPGEV